ncbi:hypothetical protein LNJ06_12620 [Tenacibaculum finnmarkense genomovar ulcerans]|uniref:hypothetical protein n=1 Tax=Tenacibaculum finnmarkense TaxID=2781243 RepID=UPI001E365461|nr:hypothetical protein [Tenacibaculum finnmarkense]MCD8431012.1 hypothetical protein [Tenacibaculum finnmarkense genomovar ulcerans]
MKTENRIAVNLIRYYQQQEALEANKEKYTGIALALLNSKYTYEITKLRILLNEKNPKRLQEIDSKRANEITVTKGIEYISSKPFK